MVLPEQQQYIPTPEVIAREVVELDLSYTPDWSKIVRIASPELPQRENKSDDVYNSELTKTLKEVNQLIAQVTEIANKAKAEKTPELEISVKIIEKASERKINELLVVRKVIESILLKAALDPKQIEELTTEAVTAATQELQQEVTEQKEKIQQLEQEKQKLEDENRELKEQLDKLKSAPPVAEPASAAKVPAQDQEPPANAQAESPLIAQIAKSSERLAATNDVKARWAILTDLHEIATDKESDPDVKKAAYAEKKRIEQSLLAVPDYKKNPQILADLGLSAEDPGQRHNYLKQILPLYKSGEVNPSTPPNPDIIKLLDGYGLTFIPTAPKAESVPSAAEPAKQDAKAAAPEVEETPINAEVGALLKSLKMAIERNDLEQVLLLAEEVTKDDPNNEKAWQAIADYSPVATRKRGAEQMVLKIKRSRQSGGQPQPANVQPNAEKKAPVAEPQAQPTKAAPEPQAKTPQADQPDSEKSKNSGSPFDGFVRRAKDWVRREDPKAQAAPTTDQVNQSAPDAAAKAAPVQEPVNETFKPKRPQEKAASQPPEQKATSETSDETSTPAANAEEVNPQDPVKEKELTHEEQIAEWATAAGLTMDVVKTSKTFSVDLLKMTLDHLIDSASPGVLASQKGNVAKILNRMLYNPEEVDDLKPIVLKYNQKIATIK